jgi:HEPN domain-containing protein
VNAEADYRRRLAEGFLKEATEDMRLERWRSCVSNSQLAAENAAKAVLATAGPVGKTHQPSALLRQALTEGRYSEAERVAIEALAAASEALGADVHAESNYGDDARWLTPWEIFGRQEAQTALGQAEQAMSNLQSLLTEPH